MTAVVALLLAGAIAHATALALNFDQSPERRFLHRWDTEQWVLWTQRVRGEINEAARL